MTERETCTCADPELRVYSTRYTAQNKIQYLFCKKCMRTAGQKRIQTELYRIVMELQVRVLELEKRSISPNSEPL